jgi:hypothetical protein
MRQVWKEAEPQRGWPQNGGTIWPDDDEYEALRRAKSNWDQFGANRSWCNCGSAGCGCSGGKGALGNSAMACTQGELTHNGARRWASVTAANNRYGYVSLIVAQFCHGGQKGKNLVLMRWDGVPLKAHEHLRPQQTEVLHGTVVHHHYAPTEHVQHGVAHEQRVSVAAAFRRVI